MMRTGESPTTCIKCNGSGEQRQVQRSFLGQIVNVQECSNCSGLGYSGGLEKKVDEVEIEVPPGVSSDTYLPIKVGGNQREGSVEDGDLIIYFTVSLIFLLILKTFSKTLVNPRYVTSFKL